MLAGELTPILNAWLGLIIDLILIVSVFGLWLTWYRNGKRQQKMEQLLMDTAQQLEEATMHLSLATSAIEQLKQQEKPIQKKPHERERPAIPTSYASAQKQVEPQSIQHQTVSPQALPPQSSTQATMILRMQREGESEESIADRLNIPLAQVKLMLKLHAASNSTAL